MVDFQFRCLSHNKDGFLINSSEQKGNAKGRPDGSGHFNNRSFQLYSLSPVPTLLLTEAQKAGMHVLKRGEGVAVLDQQIAI